MASLFPAYITTGRDPSRVADFLPGLTTVASIQGEFAYYDTSTNLMTRCGSDPALIGAFSEGSSEAGRVLTDNAQCPFYKLEEKTVIAFSSTTTPALTHIGDTYGMTRATGGQWQLDTSKSGGSYQFKVHGVDIGLGIFFCQTLAPFLQFSADN